MGNVIVCTKQLKAHIGLKSLYTLHLCSVTNLYIYSLRDKIKFVIYE
jgi:hypothetical protein